MNAYNKFAKIYDTLIYEDIDYLSWSKFILDKYNSFNNEKDDYLDIGCGTGNLAINIVPFLIIIGAWIYQKICLSWLKTSLEVKT